jgi:hypothetical protein
MNDQNQAQINFFSNELSAIKLIRLISRLCVKEKIWDFSKSIMNQRNKIWGYDLDES